MARLPDSDRQVAFPCRRHPCSAHHAALVEGYRAWRDDEYATAEVATSGYAGDLALYWAEHTRPTFRDWLTWNRTDSLRSSAQSEEDI